MISEKERSRRKQYFQDNKQELLAKSKIYKRQHRISYGNKGAIYGVNKAPYPPDNKCQCCHKQFLLSYHHNDDKNFEHGIWLCRSCHRTIDAMIRNPTFYNKLLEIAREYSYQQRPMRLLK